MEKLRTATVEYHGFGRSWGVGMASERSKRRGQVGERRSRREHAGERDDTTRHLGAAAHLGDRFAGAAIREFLMAPTRVVPPVAVVWAGAVLAEVAPARTRRDPALVTL